MNKNYYVNGRNSLIGIGKRAGFANIVAIKPAWVPIALSDAVKADPSFTCFSDMRNDGTGLRVPETRRKHHIMVLVPSYQRIRLACPIRRASMGRTDFEKLAFRHISSIVSGSITPEAVVNREWK